MVDSLSACIKDSLPNYDICLAFTRKCTSKKKVALFKYKQVFYFHEFKTVQKLWIISLIASRCPQSGPIPPADPVRSQPAHTPPAGQTLHVSPQSQFLRIKGEGRNGWPKAVILLEICAFWHEIIEIICPRSRINRLNDVTVSDWGNFHAQLSCF